jgi:hypothetical protein
MDAPRQWRSTPPIAQKQVEIPGEVGEPLRDHPDPEAIEEPLKAPRFSRGEATDQGEIAMRLVRVRSRHYPVWIMRIPDEKCDHDRRTKEELHWSMNCRQANNPWRSAFRSV